MSLMFILPLIVLYQIGIVQSGSHVRNLAEVWMTGPIAILGVPAATAVNIALIIGVIAVLLRMRRTGSVSIAFAFLMALESVIYAFLMFSGVSIAAHMLHQAFMDLLYTGRLQEIVSSLFSRQLLLGIGAGVYEELLFRVLFIGGGALVMNKVLRFSRAFSLIVLLILSSILFSAAHHVESTGEPFCRYVFIFRAISGFLLGIIFIVRGPGIPVATHAAYNILVLLSRQ